MALFDDPPSTVPLWVLAASSGCMALGGLFWIASQAFMVHRSFETSTNPAPLLAVCGLLAWSLVYTVHVCESLIELIGMFLWMWGLAPLVYATAVNTGKAYPQHAKVVPYAMGLQVLLCAAADGYFSWWWLKEPNRGYGLKVGKSWRGLEYRDTTELTWWTAGVVQLLFSAGAVYLLVRRGHSGGQGYVIWACRVIGGHLGLTTSTVIMWWYWPEAHGFVTQPLSLLLFGSIIACDIAFPFLLSQILVTEKVLPDGTVVAGEGAKVDDEKKKQ